MLCRVKKIELIGVWNYYSFFFFSFPFICLYNSENCFPEFPGAVDLLDILITYFQQLPFPLLGKEFETNYLKGQLQSFSDLVKNEEELPFSTLEEQKV